MKKLLVIALAILMIAGCSKEESSISNADDVLFEVNGVSYTKGDLYKNLTADDYSDTVLADMKEKLAEKENISTDSLMEEAEEYYEYIASWGDSYVTMYGGYDGIISSYLSYYLDDEIEKHYIDTDFDSYVENYQPFKCQYASFEDEETAKQLIQKISDGSTFEMAAAELGYDTDCTASVYSGRDSDLNNEVKAYCNDTETAGLSSVITSSTTTTDADGNEVMSPLYYVVNLISNDASEFKDEFLEYMVTNDYVETELALNMLFKNHEINIHDQEVYDTLTQTYEALEIE